MHSLYFCLILLTVLPHTANAQFAPAAGMAGSTAIAADSSILRGWATRCQVERGYINISDTTATYTQGGMTSNRAFFGTDSMATGPADGAYVSLGDGGMAVLEFDKAIGNGEGPDFAIFENSFESPPSSGTYFIELAFVEVSSDGRHYVRFPSVSLTQDSAQVGSFAPLSPEKTYNLAGKYESGYGTPFDLEELRDSTDIDIGHITHVRIVDVVGTVDTLYARHDSKGNIVNDPWPTAFHSGGFDLDAVGLIHFSNDDTANMDSATAFINPGPSSAFQLYPNPANAGGGVFFSNGPPPCQIKLYSTDGTCIWQGMATTSFRLPESIPAGLYYLHISNRMGQKAEKLLVR